MTMTMKEVSKFRKTELYIASTSSFLTGSVISIPTWMLLICPEKIMPLLTYPTSDATDFPLAATSTLLSIGIIATIYLGFFIYEKYKNRNTTMVDGMTIESDYKPITKIDIELQNMKPPIRTKTMAAQETERKWIKKSIDESTRQEESSRYQNIFSQN